MSIINDIESEASLLGYRRVKDEQLRVVTNVVSGKDVFAVLPTVMAKAFVLLYYPACLTI